VTVALALVLASATAAPVPRDLPPAYASKRVYLQLDSVPLAEVVTVLFRDILGTPYALTPEVGADRRPVSVRIDTDRAQARSVVMAYLRVFGLRVVSAGGVDNVFKVGGVKIQPGTTESVVPVAPLAVDGEPRPPARSGNGSKNLNAAPPVREIAVAYRPKYRSPAYLAGVVASLIPAVEFGRTPGDEPRLTQISQPVDVLTFKGPEKDVEDAKAIIREMDVPETALTVRATVYEVQTGKSHSSALGVALSVLGGRFSVGTGSPSSPLETFARISTGRFDAVISALSRDNRFRVVTSPSVMARSGTQAVLNSGQQVPTLGAVSYPGSGAPPVQSVQYRDSGVILKVTPTAYRKVIDLVLEQEVSSFVRTDTGVSASPTLLKRSLTSRVSVEPGQVIVVGGLTDTKDQASRSGLFGLFPQRSTEKSQTELLLLLQVDKAAEGEGSPARSASEDGGELPPAPAAALNSQGQ